MGTEEAVDDEKTLPLLPGAGHCAGNRGCHLGTSIVSGVQPEGL